LKVRGSFISKYFSRDQNISEICNVCRTVTIDFNVAANNAQHVVIPVNIRSEASIHQGGATFSETVSSHSRSK